MAVDPLGVPARVAFAGDWHCDADWAVAALTQILGQADVVVHLGDYGYNFPDWYLRPQEDLLRAARVPLLFVPGNHENYPKLARFPVRDNGLQQLSDHIWALPRGYRWEWAGIRFLACGGAYSVDRGWRVPRVSWWIEEEITAEDVAACVAGGPVDVLISHDCPAGVVIPGIDDRDRPPPFPPIDLALAREHRRHLRAVVDAVRPRHVWHGHYHIPYQRDVDFGYGDVRVTGLDCEGSLEANVRIVDLASLAGQP